MIATSSLSSASSPSSQIFRDKVFRRYSSLRPSRTAHAPRFSASCASAAERAERERTAGSCYYYSRSYSTGSAATSLAVGTTLYDVLGLAAGATPQEIKAAYRRLARAFHPDVAAAAGRKGASAEEFMRVHAAYATLSDPGKRAEYDRRVMAVMVAAPGCRRRGPPGFSWPPSGSHSSFSTSYYSPPSPASPDPSSPSSSFGRRTWETDQCWYWGRPLRLNTPPGEAAEPWPRRGGGEKTGSTTRKRNGGSSRSTDTFPGEVLASQIKNKTTQKVTSSGEKIVLPFVCYR